MADAEMQNSPADFRLAVRAPARDSTPAMILSSERYVVRDALHQDMAVYSLCLPERWQARSEVTWNLAHTAHPITLRSIVYDPASPHAMEYWPAASLYWIDPDYGMLRPNEPRLGQVALPPTSAAELMGTWLLPQVRGRMPGFTLLGVQPSPEVIGRFGVQAWDAQPEGVTARIAYEDRGVPVEEEFVAVKVLRTCPTTGPLGGATQINWGFERIASYRAPRGSLDAVRALFWEMNATVQINPAWTALAGSVQQALNSEHQGQVMARYAQMQNAQREHQAQMQQMHSAHAQNQQRFDERMAARPADAAGSSMDRNEQFRDALGGERTYHDESVTEAKQSKHSANHTFVWTDQQGRYQYSDDPMFDPNVGGSMSWVLMRERS